jgi:hypothetical protein
MVERRNLLKSNKGKIPSSFLQEDGMRSFIQVGIYLTIDHHI